MKNVTVVSNKSFRQIPSDFVCLTAAANLAAVAPTVCTFFRFRQPDKPTTFLPSSPGPVCVCLRVCLCLCVCACKIFCAVIPTGIINYPSRAAPKRHRLFVSLRVPQNVATVLAATLTSQCRLTWQSTPRKRHREWRKGRGWKAGLRCGCCWQLAESLAERKIKSQR